MRCRSVLASGRGTFGALGLGSYDAVAAAQPQAVAIPLADGSHVTKIAAGWGHSVALASNGDVFLHGQFLNFRDIGYSSMFSKASWLLSKLQPRTKQLRVHTPFKLNGPVLGRCRDVAASAALTAVVAEDGRLFTFGDNAHHQCGVGSPDTMVWPPMEVRNLHDVEVGSVAVGLNHGVLATVDGDCYTWGHNSVGQLGVGQSQLSSLDAAKRLPRSLFGGEAVAQVSAGMLHSAARTESGAVYVWGKHMSARRDQVAGTQYHHEFSPRRLDELDKGPAGSVGAAVDIASSQYSVTVRTADGRVFLLDRIPENKREASSKSEQHVPRKPSKIDLVHSAFFAKTRRAPVALQCDLEALGAPSEEGAVVAMRDGFHGSTLVTASGAVFEVGGGQSVRRVDVSLDVGLGRDAQDTAGGAVGGDAAAANAPLVVDASLGWEHSLFLVDERP